MTTATTRETVQMPRNGLARGARWIARLLLCSAYLQGAICKLFDLTSAQAEMTHFGLSPPLPFALAVIAFELVASLMTLSGRGRWLGALALAAFTFAANFMANPFWTMAPPGNMMAANGFFEHLGLVGGFLWVALDDARFVIARRRSAAS
ncbi:putative membrane protein YphA (DoxX/SURF4 family) [Luteibacter rhizovicinus]|uniref:Putative membrane protein YphA (DoxX/SURF4 family) n=1 Tax=Luteibacter rhizovicinus TaxID=242606 RepID=A0A4R3YM90_9GAMM|nr:DoxX family protein [Luteibacter rhizovicinus]TCV93426.1 putative membrane protein YphA (DoxX/SURF4 family) [Luteibacter rhizovicinus]